MPPFYDIYGLSKERNKKTIETFLNHFSYRDKIEDRTGQEILVDENKKYNIKESCTPISTLSEVINYGINTPNHGFAFYISDNLKEGVNNLILKFTYDGKIIFGVSIEENDIVKNGKLADNYNKALKIERLIEELTNSYKTSIQFEYAPSDDEEEFDLDIDLWKQMNEDKKRTLK
ncbi:MAG: hypothetical protein J7604_23425 [Sporocytophaga sp.]|uniref:hypothetical protein n=1 Tax=Sporocytophaga sp. TaxID=2231183 RepID=UPI001B1373F3|nr:hypothetical protein [Sporocytophaga sp.]MBO9703185.1 hypothetical protein [Sporocytophaga sp.]